MANSPADGCFFRCKIPWVNTFRAKRAKPARLLWPPGTGGCYLVSHWHRGSLQSDLYASESSESTVTAARFRR